MVKVLVTSRSGVFFYVINRCLRDLYLGEELGKNGNYKYRIIYDILLESAFWPLGLA